MGNYIRTNTELLDSTAAAVEKYVSDTKKLMKASTTRVNTNLALCWQGKDYDSFKTKWDCLNKNGSVNTKMLYAMESYGRYLRFASKLYGVAQEKAASRASSLP